MSNLTLTAEQARTQSHEHSPYNQPSDYIPNLVTIIENTIKTDIETAIQKGKYNSVSSFFLNQLNVSTVDFICAYSIVATVLRELGYKTTIVSLQELLKMMIEQTDFKIQSRAFQDIYNEGNNQTFILVEWLGLNKDPYDYTINYKAHSMDYIMKNY